MPKVLVVYKKSAYRLYVVERRDRHLSRLLRRGQPDARELRRAHEVHERTLEAVIAKLKRFGVTWKLMYRGDLRATASYDLIVCVGGDGTVLQASHLTGATPILGVNSDPRRSEAVFCAATRQSVARVLRQALVGELRTMPLYRLQIRLNGRLLRPLALNDVLIAHDDPATMSRYRLRIGARAEHQKSSGIWIATAAGSSSAVLAAGGVRLPWTARRFQYRPRELYRGRLSRYRLTGGVLPMHAVIRITWLMREGSLFIDGPHVRRPLRFADELTVQLSARHPLHLLGL